MGRTPGAGPSENSRESSVIRTEIAALRLRAAAPSLWKLTNTHDTAWRGAAPELLRIERPADIDPERRPMLFVHGVEYREESEVVRDLILPFEQSAGLNSVKDRYDYYFLSWNSLLFTDELRQRLKSSLTLRLEVFGRGVFAWRDFLADIERRGREAAEYLAPFFSELLAASPLVRPVVLTHSIGSYVWSHMIAQMARDGRLPERGPGNWWNMQAAVPRSAYCPGGEFADVPRVYNGQPDATMMLWYSRMDFILSTLYLLAKPGLAMGQFGSPNRHIVQRDITRWAGEAHGQNRIVDGSGHYFTRVRQLVRSESSAFGLV